MPAPLCLECVVTSISKFNYCRGVFVYATVRGVCASDGSAATLLLLLSLLLTTTVRGVWCARATLPISSC